MLFQFSFLSGTIVSTSGAPSNAKLCSVIFVYLLPMKAFVIVKSLIIVTEHDIQISFLSGL